MGINEKRLGLGVHYISTKPLLDKIKGVNLPTEEKKAPPAPPVTNEKIKKGVEA
jgi:hypothetical protein